MKDTMSDWQKHEEMVNSKIKKAADKLKNNPIADEISRNITEHKVSKENSQNGNWDMVSKAYHSAREAYMERGLTLDKTIDAFCEVLGAIKEVAKSDKTKMKPKDSPDVDMVMASMD